MAPNSTAAAAAAAEALLHSCLACPLGARRARLRTTGVPEHEQTLAQWTRYEQWLQRQLLDWQAYLRTRALAAGTVGDCAASDDADAEALEERIDDLKDKLLRQTAELARTRQYLALWLKVSAAPSRLEQQPIYAQLAFADENASEQQQRAAQLLRYRDQLVLEALDEQRQLSEQWRALNELRRQNLEAQASNRSTMSQIAAAETAKTEARREAESASQRHDPAAARRAEELATLRDVNRISRHVLQNLIVGSGVDWSQDATLLDLMLRLESAPLIDPPSSASASAG